MLVSQEGPLGTGLRNISGSLPPYMSMAILQNMSSRWTAYPLWVGGPQHYQDHQGGYAHQGQWHIPKQEPRQIPVVPHLEWGPAWHSCLLPSQVMHSCCHSTMDPHPSHMAWGTQSHIAKYVPLQGCHPLLAPVSTFLFAYILVPSRVSMFGKYYIFL